MGNEQMAPMQKPTQQTPQPQGQRNGLENFTLHKFIEDPRYGQIEIFRDKSTNTYIMGIRKSFGSYEDFQLFSNELQMRSQLSHPSLLRIYGVMDQNHQIPLNGVFKAVIYTEWQEHDLEKELKERGRVSTYYTEDEIWYLIETISSLCIFLEDNGIYHGDIIPANIQLTEEGFLKLSDFGLLSLFKNSYQKSFSGKYSSYLTPQLLSNLYQQITNPEYDPVEADVYSFGLTILYIASLVDPLSCYDFYRHEINENKINELIQLISMKYSMNLYNLIRLTLEPNDNARINFRDIVNMVKINEQGQTIAMEEYLDRKNEVQVLHRVADMSNFQINQNVHPIVSQNHSEANINHSQSRNQIISNSPHYFNHLANTANEQQFTVYNNQPQNIISNPQMNNGNFQQPNQQPIQLLPNGIQVFNQGNNYMQQPILGNENTNQHKLIIPQNNGNMILRNAQNIIQTTGIPIQGNKIQFQGNQVINSGIPVDYNRAYNPLLNGNYQQVISPIQIQGFQNYSQFGNIQGIQSIPTMQNVQIPVGQIGQRVLQNVNYSNLMNMNNVASANNTSIDLKLQNHQIQSTNTNVNRNLDLDSRVDIALRQSEETIARNMRT